MIKRCTLFSNVLKNTSILVLFLISSIPLLSQDIIDSKGKDFWIAFLPNYHNNQRNFEERLRLGDSLYIFITCDKPTSGTIEYFDRNNVKYTENFSITNPKEMYIFKLSHYDYEPIGWNYSGTFPSVNDCEKITNLAFHVTSNDEVAVYAHSQAKTTSDAFLVFPTDVLGKDYIVVAYNSDGSYNGTDIDFNATPSQFIIVSTEDSNEVTIKPSAPTKYNGLNEQKVTLNKGRSYLVQADITSSNLQADLTGSIVESKKPVSLFCGHQRAVLPISYKGRLTSRDILIEQIPPKVTWGQNAFLVPYVQSAGASTMGNDIFRIISAGDGNEIKIDDKVVALLDKGKFYEGNLTKAAVVTANSPILVAQYKKTSQEDPIVQHNSDPFIMITSPKEQYLKSYRFINVQAYEYDDYSGDFIKVYNEHYVTAVVPDVAINSLTIDGVPVSPSAFTSISNSGYSYGHLTVAEGVHEMKCDREFGILIYGYGLANSYGYVGGMSFRPIDPAPVILVSADCYKVTGRVTDSTTFDSGLTDVLAPDEFRENVDVSIGSFQQQADAATFEAKLINIYNDGQFKITARDSSGNVSTKNISIPGFTLFHPDGIQADTVPVYYPVANIGKEYCFKIPVKNYGNYEQIIKSVKNNYSDIIKTKYTVPAVLAKGQTDSIEVCITLKNDNSFTDTIYINGICGTRPLAVISFVKNDCDESLFDLVDFKDDRFIKYKGFAKKILDRIRITPSKGNANGAFWRTLKLPVRNGFVTEFAFAISDGINHTQSDGSLPGADGIAFVIQNTGPDALGAFGGGIGYEEIPNSVAIEVDLFRNDSTQIYDYYDPNGNHLAVMSMGKQPNTAKHTKEATLGINDSILEVKSNGMPYYVRIEYNLDPDVLKIYINKNKDFDKPALVLNNFKLDRLIDLENGEWAFAGFTSATANSYENHDILSWYFCPKPTNSQQVSVGETLPEVIDGLSVFPNPFAGDLSISFNVNTLSYTEVAIYNLLGQKEAVVYSSENAAPGIYSVNFDTKELSPGLYICALNTGGTIIRKNIIRLGN